MADVQAAVTLRDRVTAAAVCHQLAHLLFDGTTALKGQAMHAIMRRLQKGSALQVRRPCRARPILSAKVHVPHACACTSCMCLYVCMMYTSCMCLLSRHPHDGSRAHESGHTSPLHASSTLQVLNGLPVDQQAAIIHCAPCADPLHLLSILPFWLSVLALTVHAATFSVTTPEVRTWLDGTGLHLLATYSSRRDGPHHHLTSQVTVVELTGILAQGAPSRPSYSDGEMADLVWSICRHTPLEEFVLDGVRLGPATAAELRHGLPAMRALRRLEVCCTGASVHGIAAELPHLKELACLRLSGVRPALEEVPRFARYLGSLSALTALTLCKCKVGGGGWQEILQEVAQLPRLHALALEQTAVGGGLAPPAAAAAGGALWPQLEVLRLGSVRGGNGAVEGSDGLVSFVRQLTGLTSLSVTQTELCGEAAAAAVAPLRRLRLLKLLGNRVTAAGMAALAPRLGQLEHLTSLDLSLNQLGDGGVRVLADSMRELQQLETCRLCSNEIGDGGVVALLRVATALRCLQSVSLGMNSISDAGAAAIAGLLSSAHTLHLLHLHQNPISEAERSALCSKARDAHCEVLF